MRTVGIIAEYNPFHTGHEYHLSRAKEASGADYAVVIMSPDFVQRGEPAIFDKYTRAEMALRCGADVVIELPVCYAAGSAEYFAEGAVGLLDALGVVDALCFGTEIDAGQERAVKNDCKEDFSQIALFSQLASILQEEPEEFRKILRDGLSRGLSFPQARQEAVIHSFFTGQTDPDQAPPSGQSAALEAIPAILSSPNSILGLEYCKALLKLHSPITPLPTERKGNPYSDQSLEGAYCSAGAIRNFIQREIRGLPANAGGQNPHNYIPAGCADLFAAARRAPIFSDDLLPVLTQKLICADNPSGVRFDEILDISPDLSDRIRELRFACIGKSFDGIVSLLKPRQITETHIRRALLHLILDIRKTDLESYRKNGRLFYAHLLGFRREAVPLLHEIKKRSALPLLSKAAHASKLLPDTGMKMWNQDVAASHLYRSLMTARYGIPFRTEYEFSPIVIESESLPARFSS